MQTVSCDVDLASPNCIDKESSHLENGNQHGNEDVLLFAEVAGEQVPDLDTDGDYFDHKGNHYLISKVINLVID